MIPFTYLGKTPRQVPPIRRNARYNPFGKRDLLEWGRKDIVDTFEKTLVSKIDYEDFLKTGTASDFDIDDYLIDAYMEARTAFRLKKKIAPLALDDAGWSVIKSTLDLSSTSGYPHFKKQGEIIDQVYEDAHQLGHFMKYKKPEDVKYPPCYLSFKPAEYNKIEKTRKARDIYEYPASVKINEMRFTTPLYQAYKAQDFDSRPILFGEDVKEMVFMYWNRCIENKIVANEYVTKIDFTKFNRNVAQLLIILAFDILQENIEFGGYPISRRHAKRNLNQFHCLRHYFIHTPFVLPDRRIFQKHSGVPSGSGFTLLVNSIISRIIVNACLLKLGFGIKTSLKTCGDDAAFGTKVPFPLKEMSTAARAYNMIVHPEKCTCEEIAWMYTLEGQNEHKFKLLGYKGFTSRITFDAETLWKNTYLCSTYVLTPNDHLARVYSLFRLTQGNNSQRFCEYYNWCLVTYAGRMSNVEITIKPSNVFKHSGHPMRYGKVVINQAMTTYWQDFTNRVNRDAMVKEPQRSNVDNYYYAVAEKAARKYYFKNKDSVELWQLEEAVSSIFANALSELGYTDVRLAT